MALAVFVLIALTAHGAADGDDFDYQVCRGAGFSIDCPKDWVAVWAGNESLTIRGPSALFRLSWRRDPGAPPGMYLDQILRVYQSGESRVLSARRDDARGTLDLRYAYAGQSSRKSFVAWTSEELDRVYWASMEDDADCEESFAAFDRMIESFSETSQEMVSLRSRDSTKDAWAVVLQDLLSNYRYSVGRTLPGTTVGLSLELKVSSEGVLTSEEAFGVDLPEELAARPGIVLEILRDRGYDAQLLQARGRIWLAVKDPEGRWQAVSVNPSDPGRMIGALVRGEEWYRGVAYDNLSELTEENAMSLDISEYCDYVVQYGEPPGLVQLRPAEPDPGWLEDLEALLEGHRYMEDYGPDRFDCSNTSQICWGALVSEGYQAHLMMSYQGHPLDPHMWVAVRYGDGAVKGKGAENREDGSFADMGDGEYVAVEATTTEEGTRLVGMGRVVWEEEYYWGIAYSSSLQYSRLHPEEGMWLLPGSVEEATA